MFRGYALMAEQSVLNAATSTFGALFLKYSQRARGTSQPMEIAKSTGMENMGKDGGKRCQAPVHTDMAHGHK